MFQEFSETTLHNVNFVDVVGRAIEEHKDITFRNGIITKISDTDNSNSALSAHVLDCTGLWAVPSFIDVHAHLSFNPYDPADLSNSGAIYFNLTDAALAGVCLVRDLGVNKNLCTKIIEAQNQTNICFPEIVTAGSPICVDLGHGIEFGTCVSHDEIGSWIESHKREGHEWIKIMNDPENHSQEYLNVFVSKAHELGLMVACHAFTEKGIESAITAQVDTIEHSIPFNPDTFTRARDIYFVPTAYSAWVSTQPRFLSTMSYNEAEHLLNWYSFLETNLRNAIKENINIVAGTDGGSAPSALRDIVSEIKIFSHYGMDFMHCLEAATIASARCLKRERLYGSIEVGKYANMVLLETNPVVDKMALDKRRAIFIRGTSILNEVNSPWK